MFPVTRYVYYVKIINKWAEQRCALIFINKRFQNRIVVSLRVSKKKKRIRVRTYICLFRDRDLNPKTPLRRAS